MKEIKALFQPFLVETVLRALDAAGHLPGITLSQVKGWGRTHEVRDPSPEGGFGFADRTRLEVVVTDEMAPRVVEVIVKAARTGGLGDGKVFVSEVLEVINIRTGESGPGALGASSGGEHGA